MKIFLGLVSAIIKTVEPSANEKNRSKRFYSVMTFVVMFCIFIPICAFVGIIVYTLTKTFAEAGEASNAITLFIHLISVFSFIFGLNVIFTTFYFSDDVETLLPLPLHPWQIIVSRFTAAFISESFMQVFAVMAALIGYIIAAGLPWTAWLTAILATITAPIIPLVYCAIFCMVVMALTKWVRNKDVVNKMTGALMLVVVAALAVCAGGAYDMDMTELAGLLADRDSTLLQVLNAVFPQTPLIVSSMSQGSVINLLLYIAVLAVALLVFILLAQLLYFRGVLNTGSRSGRTDGVGDARKYFLRHTQTSPEVAYFKKEMRILFRTPAYFMNCILIGLIWPVFIYLIYVLQGPTQFLNRFVEDLRGGDAESTLYYFMVVSAISVLVTAANSIASSSLSRDGKCFSFVKVIPMSYSSQLKVKAITAIAVSGASMLVYTFIGSLVLGVNIIMTLFACLLSLISVTFAVLFGLYMDSVNPKLVWDDELNVLRGNYNIFFNMAVAMVLEAALCSFGILIYRVGVAMPLVAILLLLILLMLNSIGYYLCKNKAVKHIEDIQF